MSMVLVVEIGRINEKDGAFILTWHALAHKHCCGQHELWRKLDHPR